MKIEVLALSAVAALSSCFAMAADMTADKAAVKDADMSDPTAAYTAVGAGYGNEGLNLRFMYMSSDPSASQKTGYLLEIKDVTNKEGGDPKFAGYLGQKDERSNLNYRFRWATINTENGLGGMLDMALFDHPFFGMTAIPQVGGVATLPLTKNIYLWPVILVGGAVAEDNSHYAADVIEQQLNQMLPGAGDQLDQLGKTSSSGVDWLSTIYSFKTYARYKFSEQLWLLTAYTYTEELSGKSWHDDIKDDGLQLSSEQLEVILGYQITAKQNLRFNYHHFSGNGGADKVWVEYNYAF